MNAATQSPDEAQTGVTRIMIVDDHPIVREGLAARISKHQEFHVCGEADDSQEALDVLAEASPDVVIVDITLKSGHGLDLIEQIKTHDENIKVLVSSMHDEFLFAERALRVGASGYINKEEAPERIIDALRQVIRGEIYLSSRMTERILSRAAGGKRVAGDPIEGLSNRELEVFEMIGRGLTTRQIANRLSLSANTIDAHRENIKRKLNLRNSAELTRSAVQWVLENR